MITKKERELLNEYRNQYYNHCLQSARELAQVIDKILPKLTPKKPNEIIKVYDIVEYNCPVCVCTLELPLIKINYCPKCGQKLDWVKGDDDD